MPYYVWVTNPQGKRTRHEQAFPTLRAAKGWALANTLPGDTFAIKPKDRGAVVARRYRARRTQP